MTDEGRTDIDGLLERWNEGDAEALGQLVAACEQDLRTIASRQMATQPAGHTLQTTALLDEGWLRAVRKGESLRVEDEQHFLSLMATAMRCVLIDRARAKARRKRGDGERPASLPDDVAEPSPEASWVAGLDVEGCLAELASVSARWSDVAQRRLFGGLGYAEIAEQLDLSVSTVAEHWNHATEWLRRRLSDPREPR